jgi:two-component system OmpR family response regulator
VKLLLVEDEVRVSELLKRGLDEEGHATDVCHSGEAAFTQALAVPYDVIVLDWALPDLDGMNVLRKWRARGLRTPILMLTSRGTTNDKVLGLKAGADDYLVKPFDFEELLARLEALARRGGGGEPILALGDVRLDPRRRVLHSDKGEVSLTAREFALFSEFVKHPGEVMTRTRLLHAVWGPQFDGNPNVVDVYVGYIRGKLERLAAQSSIRTIRSMGFQLVASPQSTK